MKHAAVKAPGKQPGRFVFCGLKARKNKAESGFPGGIVFVDNEYANLYN